MPRKHAAALPWLASNRDLCSRDAMTRLGFASHKMGDALCALNNRFLLYITDRSLKEKAFLNPALFKAQAVLLNPSLSA